MMKRLVLAAGFLALAACESAPEENIPGKEPLFVTDDCAVLSALAHGQYKLNAASPKMTIRLLGEDGPWAPECNWAGLDLNLTQIAGPEGEAATAGMSRLAIKRPRYDTLGALVSTSLTSGADTASLRCRMTRTGAAWAVTSCGPDPKLTQPRAAPPSPADQTPDGRVPVPTANPNVSPRDAVIPQSDPGKQPGSNN